MVYTNSMEERLASSFGNVHFPQRTSFIKKLRYVSFIITDGIIFCSLLIFLVWIFNIPIIEIFLFQELTLLPFSSVLFIIASIPLLFGAKRHLLNSSDDTEKEVYPIWHTWVPIFFAATTAIVGFINMTLLSNGALAFLQISFFEGVCFFLLGLALIPPFTRLPHRFHITQFLIFLVSGLNIFIILEHTYQLLSPNPMQHMITVPLASALFLACFSFGILIRWSNRGFLGNFTLNSTGSLFALRLFLINLIAAPVVGFAILASLQNTAFNIYQILSVVVVCFTFISCLLLWMNVKLLYSYELEHLLMRESLRTHNIDLTTEKEELRKNMLQLEQEKQQYLNKLDTQNTWRDMVDTLA